MRNTINYVICLGKCSVWNSKKTWIKYNVFKVSFLFDYIRNFLPQNGQMNKYIFLLLFLFSLRLNGQIVGPENGTLIIVGGGKLSDTILLAFIEASGGKEAPILVIPTALGQPSYSENEGDFLRKLGAKNVKVN